MNSSIDVAIVGAGPAGAWAGYRLAKAGARVTLFDGSHPREKPCGGGVTGRALALIDQCLTDRTLPTVAIQSAVFESNGGRGARVRLKTGTKPTEQALVIASRTEFDAALLDAALAAGAELVSERVVDVSATPEGVAIRTLTRAHRCDIVMGADGANSLVRRRLHLPFRREQLSIATGYFAAGLSSREIVIRFVCNPPGYMWSFPRPDHLAIGICAQADQAGAGRLRQQVESWIRDTGIAGGAPLRSYSWPIPSLRASDFDQARPAGARWLLIGDAAGLVDPLTREGIYFALLSAEYAADALLGMRPAASEYVARAHEEIYPELRRAAKLKESFFRPRFIGLLIKALDESAPVREIMADIVAGCLPYRNLRWRLLRTFELGVAFRLMSSAIR